MDSQEGRVTRWRPGGTGSAAGHAVRALGAVGVHDAQPALQVLGGGRMPGGGRVRGRNLGGVAHGAEGAGWGRRIGDDPM
jgi:hypothetical protein